MWHVARLPVDEPWYRCFTPYIYETYIVFCFSLYKMKLRTKSVSYHINTWCDTNGEECRFYWRFCSERSYWISNKQLSVSPMCYMQTVSSAIHEVLIGFLSKIYLFQIKKSPILAWDLLSISPIPPERTCLLFSLSFNWNCCFHWYCMRLQIEPLFECW